MAFIIHTNQAGKKIPPAPIFTWQTLNEIAAKYKCRWCNSRVGAWQSYDHEGGVNVQGFNKPQWVYYVCTYCGYQWALWKILKELKIK